MALTSPQQRNTRLTAAAGLLPDHLIDQLCVNKAMITPYVDHAVTTEGDGVPVISYGLSSYGYDARLASAYKVIDPNRAGEVLDPKIVDPTLYEDVVGPTLVIPAYGFALGHTMEYFKIPDDVMVICMAKSTYARIGLVVGISPLEPEWEGEVTLEFSNTTPLPIKLYAHEGICQFLFFKGMAPPHTSYADRKGKYQRQRGVTLPKLMPHQDAA